MSKQLGEPNILVADPPFRKSHWHSHKPHRCPCQQWYTSNIKKLLLCIGIECQERARVLGKVVSAVVFPKHIVFVHRSMVPVEPKVEYDTIQADLQRQPGPAHGRWRLATAVAEKDGHHGPVGRGLDHCGEDFANGAVGNTISLVLVAVKEAVFVPKT